MMNELVIEVRANGFEFPDEINCTFDTLLEFYEILNELGIELEGRMPELECSIEQKVMGYTLCG